MFNVSMLTVRHSWEVIFMAEMPQNKSYLAAAQEVAAELTNTPYPMLNTAQLNYAVEIMQGIGEHTQEIWA